MILNVETDSLAVVTNYLRDKNLTIKELDNRFSWKKFKFMYHIKAEIK